MVEERDKVENEDGDDKAEVEGEDKIELVRETFRIDNVGRDEGFSPTWFRLRDAIRACRPPVNTVSLLSSSLTLELEFEPKSNGGGGGTTRRGGGA